ncbi:NUDIX domain-containing protein [Streptomyces coelicoflavus]|uniref:NUDIX domain-containing protein n=1 Tax=Streptomyces coelicoflavus TaxID=285562 RepID=UPI00210DAF3E|nr:NUDIX domain-containing protein [Streptomyces coelicoflavus]MCQ4200287.1 NUDIX domain-containing protein [Streptomyces coelicoflavus]
MPLSHHHIRTTVDAYLARHPHEREKLSVLLDALDRPGENIASRSTFTGHVTCGAIVVDQLGRVLHVLHLASGKVLAPGGHTEPTDDSLAVAALRELHEETGIPARAVTPWPDFETVPLDIDIHDIDAHPGKGEPGHQHFDLRFLFRLQTTEVSVVPQEEEVGGIEWRPVDRVTSPTLREKLLKLPLQAEPETANASALIYNDRGEYLLHLRDYFPGQIWEPGMWSLLGGGREPQDATLEHTVRRELAEEAGLDLADLSPFATEYASHDDGTTVPITVYAGRWNGDPRELHLTEGVMLAWFAPDNLHRLRIADTTSDLVRRHAASLPPMQSEPAPEEQRPASPHGTVPNIIGVHLYLERPDGTVLLGLRHPDSAFAPSTWHVLAGHCEQENAIDCLIREAMEEAGLHIERQDVELVHVVHHIDKPGSPPRMGLFFRARTWGGEPVLREPDRCTQWKFWDPAALPDDLVPYTRLAITKIRNGELYSETGWPA